MVIGYAYIVGDILHKGHILHLKNCRALCDKLIVGVLTGKAVLERKPKPILSLVERMAITESLKYVDLVVVQETYSPLPNVKKIRPDILMESTSHTDEAIKDGERVMKVIKGKVIVLPYYPLQSSTKIKDKIKNG